MNRSTDRGELPLHHRDPFDGLLIAQALDESMTLISADRTMALHDLPPVTNG